MSSMCLLMADSAWLSFGTVMTRPRIFMGSAIEGCGVPWDYIEYPLYRCMLSIISVAVFSFRYSCYHQRKCFFITSFIIIIITTDCKRTLAPYRRQLSCSCASLDITRKDIFSHGKPALQHVSHDWLTKYLTDIHISILTCGNIIRSGMT